MPDQNQALINLSEQYFYKLWKRLQQSQAIELTPTDIKPLNWNMLRAMEGRWPDLTLKLDGLYLRANHEIQKVNLANHEELVLVRDSLNRYRPKELCRIKILTKNNIHTLPTLCGKSHLIATWKELEKILHKAVLKIRQQGETIELIQIIHTHPSLEFYFLKNGHYQKVLHPLSSADLYTGNILCEHLNFPIQISAVTPSGITYTKNWNSHN